MCLQQVVVLYVFRFVSGVQLRLKTQSLITLSVTQLKREARMKLFFGMLLGYVVHDAIQPTPVGEVLDKILLPADLFVTPEEAGDASDSGGQL